jgi:hypothetical protein
MTFLTEIPPHGYTGIGRSWTRDPEITRISIGFNADGNTVAPAHAT